jgi:hypothetical protein
MNNFVVYAYCREDGTFYYIGKGKPERPYSKRIKGINPPRNRSRILILHEGLSEGVSFEYEKKLILFYGRKDLGTGLLRNKTNGGEGVSGWVPGENWRKGKSIIAAKMNKIKHAEKDERGKSIAGVESAKRLHEEKDENGKSVNSMKAHFRKNEDGKSVLGVKNAKIMHAKKDEEGRSVQGVINGEKINAEKDENGKSVNAVRGGERAAGITNSQTWRSTIDGFLGNPGNVAQHNKARGWDPGARVLLSDTNHGR